MAEQADNDRKPNWFKRHKILTGLIVIFVLFCLAGAAAPRTTINNHAPDTAQNVQNTVDPSLAKSPPPAPAAQPTVLLDQTGSGQAQTKSFTATGNWTVTYTFDCSSFGQQGNFQFDVDNPDGSYDTDTGANDLALNGGNTDYYYDAGQHYLSINSECNWHITVKG